MDQEPPRPITFRDPEIQKCPFGAYAKLRDEAPVYWDPEIQCYVVSRFHTNEAILRDTQTYTRSLCQ